MTQETFNFIVGIWIVLAIVMVPPQLVVTAPYGRHISRRWGPVIGNRLGWILMEAISPVAFLIALFYRGLPTSAPVWVFTTLWVAHYLNRGFIYPLRTKTAGKTIPLVIVVSGILFNIFTGWSNGYYLGSPWADYPPGWFADPRFLAGLAIFLAGAAINIRADNRLLALRKQGETGYVIPRGGLFDRVSCPNHLGEIIEWTGFAVLCWNLPATAFAIWTAANLGPRAISHHRWYTETFADYPPERRALIPYVL